MGLTGLGGCLMVESGKALVTFLTLQKEKKVIQTSTDC